MALWTIEPLEATVKMDDLAVPRSYRKKPVAIEAVRFTEQNGRDLAIWSRGLIEQDNVGNVTKLHIRTLEGTMEAAPGDYIIKGVKGEFYPVRQDIFEETYEAVNG